MPQNFPSALSPNTWPFGLECLPPSAYLVGGAVRDALLERQSDYLDLDFVMPELAVETAQKLARRYGAGFVLLDAERQIARVVFEQATVDFAQQEGATLEIDLHRRDFTANAIAYNPHTNELIDPLRGYDDLTKKWLRMVSPLNLKDDPLRLLRAYRQAAQLNFTLEPATRSHICHLAPLLGNVAAERARSEFDYLLRSDRGTAWIVRAWEDGLVSVWFPSVTAAGLERLAKCDRAAVALTRYRSELGEQLQQQIRPTIKTTWLAIAKLTGLLSSDSQKAEGELLHLKYSRAEIRAAIALLENLPKVSSAEAVNSLSVRDWFFLFQTLEQTFPALAVLAVAIGTPMEAIAPWIDRYLTPDDPVAHPRQLINGKELMAALHLRKGPQIGRLLREIQVAQAEGKVAMKADAIQFAQALMAQQGAGQPK